MNKFMELIFLVTLIVGLSSWPSEAATRQDLQGEINALVVQAEKNSEQSIAVINALTVALAPPLSLTVGVASGVRGTVIDVPIHFKSGASAVSGLQFDIAAPTGISISSVTAGIAALAAGKSVQVSPVAGGLRGIVFGLNSNAISSGPVAVLKVSVAENASVGKNDLLIRAISASSPTGTSVVLTGKDGSVTLK